MLNKKVFIRCLIAFAVWVIGQLIILNIHLDKPHIVSRVWGVLCLVIIVIINVVIGLKKDDENE